jgi:DNA replication protein DnaC
VGKTHALVAVIRGLIQTHGVMARFVHVAGLMLDLRLAMNDPHASPASVLGSLATVPVLGLDELVRPRTEWGQEVISELFQLRYQANLTTLATTNLDEDGLAVGLGPGLGELVTSRLKEWAPIITIGGRDLRTQ